MELYRELLSMLQKLTDGHLDVFCNPLKQWRRYVSTFVKGNCCASAIAVPELLVRPFWRTSLNPSDSRILMTSAGFRTGIFPMGQTATV